MNRKALDRPGPLLGRPWQSGITDPVWDGEPPYGASKATYEASYSGQLERQRHLHIVTANIEAANRAALSEILVALTHFANSQMARRPPKNPKRPYDAPVLSNRVTITVGLGATLFTTLEGDDRFDLAALRPSSLKVMPQIDGDEEFRPRDYATDLIVLIASDDFYVNEYLFGLLYYGNVHQGIKVRRVERGYARPDGREPSGFEDGTSNPKDAKPDFQMRNFVYVTPHDQEPAWCVNGTYLAYRKIRRRLRSFFQMKVIDQEKVFGTNRGTGERKSAPADAHAHKMNPRRGERQDIFGRTDDSRRFLRRPYFFNDGLTPDGEELRGLHHLSFARDLGAQYEWPVLMWQTNPDFPTPGAGRDALYSRGGASNIAGGYYFLPAAAPGKSFLAAGLLK